MAFSFLFGIFLLKMYCNFMFKHSRGGGYNARSLAWFFQHSSNRRLDLVSSSAKFHVNAKLILSLIRIAILCIDIGIEMCGTVEPGKWYWGGEKHCYIHESGKQERNQY